MNSAYYKHLISNHRMKLTMFILLFVAYLFSHFRLCSELMTWAGCRCNQRPAESWCNTSQWRRMSPFSSSFLSPFSCAKADFLFYCLGASESQSDIRLYSKRYHQSRSRALLNLNFALSVYNLISFALMRTVCIKPRWPAAVSQQKYMQTNSKVQFLLTLSLIEIIFLS